MRTGLRSPFKHKTAQESIVRYTHKRTVTVTGPRDRVLEFLRFAETWCDSGPDIEYRHNDRVPLTSLYRAHLSNEESQALAAQEAEHADDVLARSQAVLARLEAVDAAAQNANNSDDNVDSEGQQALDD